MRRDRKVEQRGFRRLAIGAAGLLLITASAAIPTLAKERHHMTTATVTRTLAVGDKTLAYTETGSGPAVVIVHGVGGRKEDWQGVAAALAKTHHVFAIDMLGFGESSKTGDDLSMRVQAAAIAALLDHCKIAKADLVGNSVGGWVATTFAATYADRTNKLVIMDAAGFKAMFEGAPPVNFDPGSPEEMQKLIDFTINGPVAKTPGLAEKAYAAYVASGEKAISATWGKSLFQSPRLEQLFPKVKAPTTVLWGADDKLFPAVLCEAFAGQIAGAKCEKIAGAGHFLQIDRPEATIKAISAALN